MSGRLISFGGSRLTGSRWFRAFGVGLNLRSPRYRPSFGEEHGLRRTLLNIGGWRLYALTPASRPKTAPRTA